MNHSFQNINANCRNLEQEFGGTFLFINQCWAQPMDEQEQERVGTLFDLLR